ncbi:hypothetical protein ACFQFC_33885 [Amorphoplanes digitatis]|uniref:Uncharacterized protein n=1 Tax=Actinoplanes digitatis TaxID=1868 RepID=A0A7W7MNL0_9ACTN|nr:hypothetical protein [Actinoplanes digitatis]BFE69517.1 hypothetical protein GCM10020092_028180 [Actinoplanes digitatis]GID92769.1 hypothetical protein Adi01nite_21810 [Actinoplanes digitatis]
MTGPDLSDALSDMWSSVLLFVPIALAFIAILIIGYVLARIARTVVGKTLRRVGFDRGVERGAIGRALGGRVEPSDLCAKIAFYAVLLFALQLAFGVWGPNAVSDLLTALVAWLPRAFVSIVIIVVAAAIGGAVRDLIGSVLGGLPYGRVLAQAAYWLIVALGVIAALEQVQIATAVTQPILIAVLATVAGVLIVGVGGGLIRPMQQRWELWLERAGAESAAIREHARNYADERARAAAGKKAAEEAAAARAAEEARAAEQARVAEQERIAREAALAETARVEAERAAAEAARLEAERVAAEAERQRAARAAAAEATQVIPLPRSGDEDDRPHPVPGFGEPRPPVAEAAGAETTTRLTMDTSAEPGPAAEPDSEPDTEPNVGGGRARPADDPDATADTGGGPARPAEDPDGTDKGGTPETDDSDKGGTPETDDSDTTVDIASDPDTTAIIPVTERRQVIPRQGGSADADRTQVIPARKPGDET